MNTLSRRHFLKLASASAALAATPSILRAQSATSKAHIVVVGGGFGGATVAKYLRLWGGANAPKVTLVDANLKHVSCILSNMVLDNTRSLSSITFGYDNLRTKYSVDFVQGKAISFDNVKKLLKLANGTTLAYDHLVLSPGIDFEPVLDTATNKDLDFNTIPHAWQAGPQTTLLKQQLQQFMSSSSPGNVIITAPLAPIRCPIGPYERACTVADMIKRRGKSGAKVILLDANPGIMAEVNTFTMAFNKTFAGIIEYHKSEEVESVDSIHRIVRTKTGKTFQASVLNVIPPHRAGAIVRDNELVPDLKSLNWGAPVDPLTYESDVMLKRGIGGIHIIGDSQGTGLSKGGHVANGEAKVCADAILRMLNGEKPDPGPTVPAACFNSVTSTTGSWLSTLFAYDPATKSMIKVKAPDNPTGTFEAPAATGDNYERIFDWSANLFADTFA